MEFAPSLDERSGKPCDTALRYLMCAEEKERKKWGERAVALGFPREELRTESRIVDLLPWVGVVESELLAKGLFHPKAETRDPKPTAQVIQLPLWPEPVRGVPNDVLRSALFAAIQGKTRRFIKNEVLATLDGLTIKFYGGQLDQSDLDVWEQAIHLARSQPLGNVCHFKANAFLKEIGRGNGKSQYQWLHDSITRLVGCAVEIRNGSRVFTGSLLSSCARDEKTGIYQLTLDPKTIKLYSTNNWSSVEWKQRQALIGKPLALWLHGYYSSHAAPFPVKVDTLRKLCGSQAKDLRDFRRNLRSALDELCSASIIASWVIDPSSDLVNVGRGEAITDSQRRHLATPRRPRKPRA